MSSVKPEVQSFSQRPDGTRVEVDVTGFIGFPEDVAELRARAAAFATSGVATPPIEVLDNIEIGKLKRFTEVASSNEISGGRGLRTIRYVIEVNRPY